MALEPPAGSARVVGNHGGIGHDTNTATRPPHWGPRPSGSTCRNHSEETFAWIEGVFAEHPVLLFRGRDLGALELAAFGRRRAPRPHALIKYRHADCGSLWLTNVEETGRSWVRRQARHRLAHRFDLRGHAAAAVLHAKEVPRKRAAPCSPTCAPLEACRERNSCCPPHGLHGRSTGPAGGRRMATTRATGKNIAIAGAVAGGHAASVTGRQILFVNPTHAWLCQQAEEAWPLIEELGEHATQERFVYYTAGASAMC
jgi:hypothetical protein